VAHVDCSITKAYLAGVYIEAFRFLEENVHMGIDDRDGYEGGRSLEFTGVYHNGRVGQRGVA
jgi:hypothetical protein